MIQRNPSNARPSSTAFSDNLRFEAGLVKRLGRSLFYRERAAHRVHCLVHRGHCACLFPVQQYDFTSRLRWQQGGKCFMWCLSIQTAVRPFVIVPIDVIHDGLPCLTH